MFRQRMAMADIEQGKQKFQVSSCLVSHIEREWGRRKEIENEIVNVREEEREREIEEVGGR